jgi:hypothetical protein
LDPGFDFIKPFWPIFFKKVPYLTVIFSRIQHSKFMKLSAEKSTPDRASHVCTLKQCKDWLWVFMPGEEQGIPLHRDPVFNELILSIP